MPTANIKVFCGNANISLCDEVTALLSVAGGKAIVSRFSDGESQIEILENVRGADVFIIQPICPPEVEKNLMELLIMVDALTRASVAKITAIIPYFGYSRQDRRTRLSRVPITAKLIAKMISAAGVNQVVAVDLHTEQIQGFFDVPVDNIYASPVLTEDIARHNYHDIVIVSPDVGGVVRARAVAKELNDADLAIIDKRRPEPNKIKIMNVIGKIEGRTCIIIDDIVDTATTLCQAANVLKQQGAQKVVAYATHPVLSGNAIENIEQSILSELVVTNSIPLSKASQACTKIRQLSLASTLAEVIRRICSKESVISIFSDDHLTHHKR